MRRETERDYVAIAEQADNADRWNSEHGYFKGLADDGDGSSWVDALTQVLPVAATIYQQREFNKMNQALIAANKPPISADTYMTQYAPATKVAVGPDDAAKKMILYGGLGLLALVGLRAAKVI